MKREEKGEEKRGRERERDKIGVTKYNLVTRGRREEGRGARTGEQWTGDVTRQSGIGGAGEWVLRSIIRR